jgi:hypothetical protein
MPYVIKMNEEYYNEWEMFNWIHSNPDINEAIQYDNLEDANTEMKAIKEICREIDVSVVEVNNG